jgi:hypothetical protein
MIDLEKGSDQLDKADGFLTKLKTILKKHWGIMLLLLIGFGIYKFIVAVGEEMDNPTTPVETFDEYYYEEGEYQQPSKGHKGIQQHESTEESYYITKEAYFIDPSGYRMGDTVYVDYYSDGYTEQYYPDGELYYED